ncbi:MAG TPA: hypothetical protein VIB62_00885 [Actinomycetota bacterium]
MRHPGRLRLLPLAILLAACGGSSPTASGAPSVADPTTTPPSATPPPSSDATPGTPTPSPELPAGLPASFEEDVAAADVPAQALVPPGTDVTETWYGATADGEAIVVAWVVPGGDPFRLAHGLAVWRRSDGADPPWRAVYGQTWPKRAGVLGVSAITADLTGDRSDDALVFAMTGGSGACGTYIVLDLAAARRVFDRRVCDTTIEPAAPPGLLVHEAVFRPEDPHCCPSAFRETVLGYRGPDDWTVVSETVTPAG